MYRPVLLLLVASLLTGCSEAPTGSSYRRVNPRIAGAYRTLAVPAGHATEPFGVGAEVRLVLGTSGAVTGRLILGGGENEDGSTQRFVGSWESNGVNVRVHFDERIDTLPDDLLLVAAFSERRVELHGTMSLDGASVSVAFWKPVNDAGSPGGGSPS